MSSGEFTLCILFGGAILFCTFMWGFSSSRTFHQQAAIKAGVAHYEVNPTTGEVKFVYNTVQQPEAGKP